MYPYVVYPTELGHGWVGLIALGSWRWQIHTLVGPCCIVLCVFSSNKVRKHCLISHFAQLLVRCSTDGAERPEHQNVAPCPYG